MTTAASVVFLGKQNPNGGKHDGCPYFVLDLVHDRFAAAALRAYAAACAIDYPDRSRDLVDLADKADKMYAEGSGA